MKKIAIKGHHINRLLIIDILCFLGGTNSNNLAGSDSNMYYFIDDKGNINRSEDPLLIAEEYMVYTIEEIMAKLLTVNYPRQVLVSNDAKNWETRVLFGYDPYLIDPYLCYSGIEILEDIESRQMGYAGWPYMKEIEAEPITELTIAQIAKKLNIKVENLKIISDEK